MGSDTSGVPIAAKTRSTRRNSVMVLMRWVRKACINCCFSACRLSQYLKDYLAYQTTNSNSALTYGQEALLTTYLID
jgi:hypothetical protein